MVKFFDGKYSTNLKRLIAIVLVLSCSIGTMAYGADNINPNYSIVASAYSSGNYKVNTSSGVNVRTGAGTGYSRAGSATNGTTFSVDQVNGSWGHTSSIKCTNGYKSGWVCLQYCSYTSSNSSNTSSSGSSKGGFGVVYNCSALNVRKGPGTGYAKKNTIKCGTTVCISFTSGNWGYDTLHSGYVSLSYVKFTGSGSSSGNGNNNNSYVSLGNGRAFVFEPLCARGKVVDVSGWGTSNGTNIQIWDFGSSHQANQMFKPVYMGNGYYCFMDTNSGKYIDVSGGIVANGTNVHLYEYNGTAAQQWRVVYGGKASNGKAYYYIQSKLNSNYYLDISGGNSSNGTNVQFWVGNSTNAQKYALYYTSYNGGSSNNDNNSGYSSFKPLQQGNYGNLICDCGATISSSGCGPMSTINAVGYLTGKQMDISSVANTVRRKKLHSCGAGCYWSVSSEIAKSLGSTYGFKVTNSHSFGSKTINGQGGYPTQSAYDSLWSEMVSHLKKGEVAVTLVQGHFIAIVAYNSSTNKVLVYDSAASKSRGTTTNGDWKSYNELNCNSSSGYIKLKLRASITYLART